MGTEGLAPPTNQLDCGGMGLLDEPGLERLIGAGCPKCSSLKLSFRTYVDGLLPIMGAEPIGRITWVYDGEKFVDGVYEVSCAECKEVVFATDVCPRCHAPGGLGRALETPNGWSVPVRCAKCDGEELRYIALVPALVTYEGKRAQKARSATELHEDGFHGYRVDCRDCGTVAERTDGCPLCDAPAPLRPRPG
jgi:RNA polymerase subunit RPABC4/transcription elongation factor Spt4